MIGLIPCAGSATRIHGIPKYLLPVPDGYLLQILTLRMGMIARSIAIGANTLNYMQVTTYAPSKASVYIADHYGTMTETVLSGKGYASIDGVITENTLFAMPDTYIEDDACFAKLADTIHNGADVAVGVFYARTDQHLKAGMCRLDGERVIEVVDKPAKTDMRWLWGALAWKPTFWDYMQPEDAHVGYALPRAIAAGLDVRAVRMTGGYFDCGTYDEYAELTNYLHGRKQPAEMSTVYA